MRAQLVCLVSLGLFIGSCSKSETSAPAATHPTVTPTVAQEWVSFHTEYPIAASELHALVSGLVGDDAANGSPLRNRTLTPGLFVDVAPDTTTSGQNRLTFAFDDGGATPRTLAVAPASYELGAIYAATIDAAAAKMQADVAGNPNDGEAFYLEYRVASTQGGRLSFGVKADRGKFSIVVDVGTPKTSLETNKIGTAAFSDKPFDTIAGTVWFHMSKDDFDYFTNHAYGKDATSRQNFTDFALVPHEWLRLTVEPHLADRFVNVGFEVIALDGRRLALAKAPASVLAGDVFRNLVLQNMKRMNEQEAAAPGSSIPWQAPFYYDAPEHGGVVQVIAQGDKGSFSVAYSVESPRHALTDVEFLEYRPVNIPPPDPMETASCEKLGDPTIQLAAQGTLDITFKASDVIKGSATGPLQGTIYCSVFKASDVNVTGPLEGAVAVQDFQVADADLLATPAPGFVTDVLLAGSYQVLCAQDLDGSGGPSHGDPVTLPIGAFPVACNKNPSTVEFALFNPQD